MEVELLQPWSTFVMKTKLPPLILEKMIKITDEVVTNVESRKNFSWEDSGSGQMEDEFYVELEILERENVMEFFLNVIQNFVEQQLLQSQHRPSERKKILNEEWYIQLITMWII